MHLPLAETPTPILAKGPPSFSPFPRLSLPWDAVMPGFSSIHLAAGAKGRSAPDSFPQCEISPGEDVRDRGSVTLQKWRGERGGEKERLSRATTKLLCPNAVCSFAPRWTEREREWMGGNSRIFFATAASALAASASLETAKEGHKSGEEALGAAKPNPGLPRAAAAFSLRAAGRPGPHQQKLQPVAKFPL